MAISKEVSAFVLTEKRISSSECIVDEDLEALLKVCSAVCWLPEGSDRPVESGGEGNARESGGGGSLSSQSPWLTEPSPPASPDALRP